MRDPLDRFYTLPSLAKSLCTLVKSLELPPVDCIIEPSAGNGVFLDAINDTSLYPELDVYGSDIDPVDPRVTQADFLTVNIDVEYSHYNSLLFIGNPPFGKQASMAVKFFNKCASSDKTKVIAMILPRSFRKPYIQKRLHLNFHLIHDHEIESALFTMNHENIKVPCIFQVWELREKQRQLPEKQYPAAWYRFISRPDSYKLELDDTDNKGNLVCIRRVGRQCGHTCTFSSLHKLLSPQSHYYIKCLDGVEAGDVSNYLNQCEWPDNNTTGPKSISKQEIITNLNSMR